MSLLVAWAAAAQVAAAALPSHGAPPSYEAGDAFVYSDGRVERVRRVAGETVVWSGLKGRSWRRARNPVVPVLKWRVSGREGRRTITGEPDRLWPLRKGASARFRVVTETRGVNDRGWKRALSLWVCKVGAQRPVAVKAGRFDAWPIACDRYSATNMKLLEQVSWDYAPDLGHWVRRTTVDYRRARRTSIELTAALHGPGATRQRLAALAAEARGAAER